MCYNGKITQQYAIKTETRKMPDNNDLTRFFRTDVLGNEIVENQLYFIEIVRDPTLPAEPSTLKGSDLLTIIAVLCDLGFGPEEKSDD